MHSSSCEIFWNSTLSTISLQLNSALCLTSNRVKYSLQLSSNLKVKIILPNIKQTNQSKGSNNKDIGVDVFSSILTPLGNH